MYDESRSHAHNEFDWFTSLTARASEYIAILGDYLLTTYERHAQWKGKSRQQQKLIRDSYEHDCPLTSLTSSDRTYMEKRLHLMAVKFDFERNISS